MYNVLVTQASERSYEVTISDFKSLASPSSKGNYFVQLPLEPDNLRLSTNTVVLNPALTVSDLSISQSVATEPDDDGTSIVIKEYLKKESALWESAGVDEGTGNIVWLQDLDARSNAAGEQVKPDEYLLPMFSGDDSVGVLQFTVTLPDTAEGEVSLFDSLTSTYTSGKFSVNSETWEADAKVMNTVAGCSVTLPAVPNPDPDPKPDPEPKPDPDPDPDPKPEPKPEPAPNPEPAPKPGPTPKPAPKEQLAQTGGTEATALIAAAGALVATGAGVTLYGVRRKAAHR